jgi:hypothetical protein
MTRWLLCATTLLILSMSVATRGAETFGAAPTLPEATPIPLLLAKPADFQGKTVRVEGIVTGVCTMMGCWMALAPTDAPKGPAILIKVDDGVIVFPTSARGKRATAQGVVERVGAGDAEGQEAAREYAEQQGKPSTSGSGATSAKTESATTWRIKATGAIVY